MVKGSQKASMSGTTDSNLFIEKYRVQEGIHFGEMHTDISEHPFQSETYVALGFARQKLVLA